MKMSYDCHIVIDFEFNPIPRACREARSLAKNEIIQIGAVVMNRDYEIQGRFLSYVRPEYSGHIREHISALTGICDDDVQQAPDLQEALHLLTEWLNCRDKRVRTYSWSFSDLDQLLDECALKDIPLPEWCWRWMDFQRVYERLITGTTSPQALSLRNAVASVDEITFNPDQAHSALYDAVVTAELLRYIHTPAFPAKIQSIRQLFSPQKAQSLTLGDLYGCRLANLAFA